MSRPLSVAAVAALLLATVNCNGATAPANPEGCLQNVEVTVSTQAIPVFAWSPTCGVSFLSVSILPSAPGSEETVWSFSVPERTPIGPAVRYGTPPAGATVSTEPRQLLAGATYRIRVMYIIGGDGLAGQGERLFTR